MKIETMATVIATEANKCCERSDGYEEAIKALAEGYLIETWNDAIEEAALRLEEANIYNGKPYADIIRKLKK